jgi:RES domain-containing protein
VRLKELSAWHRFTYLQLYPAVLGSMLYDVLHITEGWGPLQVVEIEIPRGISYEELTEANVPGWHEANCVEARTFGARWFEERRSCILLVPSVVARLDRNILINPRHPDFAHIRPSRERPIWWDGRLFAKS